MTTQPAARAETGGGANSGPDTGHRTPPSIPLRATVRCINRLQNPYRRNSAAAVATLARLRRGVGRPPHDSPDTWGIDGLEELAQVREESGTTEHDDTALKFFSADERLRGERRELAEESAVHLAVTLWALHQQSVREADMHAYGWSLGRAVRRLARGESGTEPAAKGGDPSSDEGEPSTRGDEDLSETLRKRFIRIGTSNSFDALSVRLRELVLLLRASRIPVDYGRLAQQLYAWQDESLRPGIRRAWGREFHLSYESSSRPAETAAGESSAPGADEDHEVNLLGEYGLSD
ncbi:type I-E CRISPR-associated protein Cse2/CasB [Streptomyces sp. NPDC059398]|uniref:type I-E CRISPR-associated protein Cse2/CasB n=1 Tax=Streptomyces sp. NPDC059398 TaxID=3346820 RepID=UPI00369286F2